ncbi:RmlC-like cupin domain-containing protein [Fusarium oxysporum Fo47]|uniref:Quercetin 2,3-dioxygenase n=2 Tax=Fusarium oxysporum TaxID=5507 RepID=A0A8H5A3Z2_FUSOX|nr:RmlC-like cupin domain-containing protein [Fusarium oxysporum Fo47]EWZ33059.1 hypothetical protein FOZG_14554 [Fusarium oxysporum Fo47]KAF5257784.1 hypothetical protein FOXYS1_11675 [Fusarium oxysporum]QKD60195.1 RmlC-like cupin domain-containing protein [Fusarium oxysporum Fo47]
MKPSVAVGLLLSAAHVGFGFPHKAHLPSLYVDIAPQSPRPYVIAKDGGEAVRVGSEVDRFLVTGNSSGGAFSFIPANGPYNTALNVVPHMHKKHYESFYCSKGRALIWAKSNTTESSNLDEEGRLFAQGDYAAVPPNTVHAFEFVDPDTEWLVVFVPGGTLEDLLATIKDGVYPSPIGSEYNPDPAIVNKTGGNPAVLESLLNAPETFDNYPQLDFTPRRDFVDGIAGSGNWHNGSNTLAENSKTPNFIANNFGPKFLNEEDGVFKIITPLVTGNQTDDQFTMGTITLSKLLPNQTATEATAKYATGLHLQEGELTVEVDQYETAQLIDGDLIFLPQGTTFRFFASAPETKFLYVIGGPDGLDYELLQNSKPWEFASYPQYPSDD